MKLRSTLLIFVMLAIIACGGAADEPGTDTDSMTDASMMDDAAMLDEQLEYFVTHFNMGHANMIIDQYTEDAVMLGADGMLIEGREAIEEGMAAEMMANSPMLAIEVVDRVITAEHAVTFGTWMETMGAGGDEMPAEGGDEMPAEGGDEMPAEGGDEMPAEGGEMMSPGGHVMTLHVKVDGEWKTSATIVNFATDMSMMDDMMDDMGDMEEMPGEMEEMPGDMEEMPGEMEEMPGDMDEMADDMAQEGDMGDEMGDDMAQEDAMADLTELLDFYMTHFNMGHGGMVADRYAEDAMVAFANMALANGREAVAAQLGERIEADGMPQITITEMAVMGIGDGWTVGRGMYETVSSTGDMGGMSGLYMMLVGMGDDGNMQIQWLVTNGMPTAQ